MVALLAEIRDRTPLEHPFLGDFQEKALEEQLARLTKDADPLERGSLLFRLGWEELKLGENEKSIQRLGEAVDLMPLLEGRVKAEEAGAPLFNLALAWMRWGETRNCVAHHTTESCLMPIQGSGVHVETEGSTKAIHYLLQVLKKEPGDVQARWLLNIAYMTLGEYPSGVPREFLIPPDTFASDEPFPRFKDIAPSLGLNVFNLSGGVIADDFDNDGFLDIMISTFDTSGQILYFHNDGDGAFSDR